MLKANHGSGMNIIINDKSKYNLESIKKIAKKWMNINYAFTNGFELHYMNIKPKIIAEMFYDNKNGDLFDYKIYCFNGEPKFIRVQKSLPDHSAKINNFYNLDWTLNDIETGLNKHFIRRPDVIFQRPKNLELMIQYSRKLSSEFAFVRIDFYDLNEKIYLGEMTFSPSNIIFNNKDKNQSLYLGNLLDISKIPNV